MLTLKDLEEKRAQSPDFATEKGGTCGLKALPLKIYHFNLTKREFRDEIALIRMRSHLVKLLSLCAVEKFLMKRVLLIAQKGVLRASDTMTSVTFANLLNDVCTDVEALYSDFAR